jgi:hypothetical protein
MWGGMKNLREFALGFDSFSDLTQGTYLDNLDSYLNPSPIQLITRMAQTNQQRKREEMMRETIRLEVLDELHQEKMAAYEKAKCHIMTMKELHDARAYLVSSLAAVDEMIQ